MSIYNLKALWKITKQNRLLRPSSPNSICVPYGRAYLVPYGFFVHSALALTPDSVPLGLLVQHTWVLAQAPTDSAHTKRKRLFADKESYKWLDALRAVEDALPTAQTVLLIQDSEADIFAFFAAERRAGLDLLICTVQPRCKEVVLSK